MAHQTFTDAETLDSEIYAAVDALNQERSVVVATIGAIILLFGIGLIRR